MPDFGIGLMCIGFLFIGASVGYIGIDFCIDKIEQLKIIIIRRLQVRNENKETEIITRYVKSHVLKHPFSLFFLRKGLSATEIKLVNLFAKEVYYHPMHKRPTKHLEPIFTALLLLDDGYLRLVEEFDEAVDNDNYIMAYAAFRGIVKILPNDTNHHEKLRIKMLGLTRPKTRGITILSHQLG